MIIIILLIICMIITLTVYSIRSRRLIIENEEIIRENKNILNRLNNIVNNDRKVLELELTEMKRIITNNMKDFKEKDTLLSQQK
jgi:hypothetical protein